VDRGKFRKKENGCPKKRRGYSLVRTGLLDEAPGGEGDVEKRGGKRGSAKDKSGLRQRGKIGGRARGGKKRYKKQE